MSLQLNKFQIAGNLAADPEFRILSADRSVCNFCIITNRTWKNDAGARMQEATPVRCSAWGKTADFIAGHFGKGQAIYAEGRLKLATWEKDGQKHSTLELVVDEVRFVTNAPQPQQQNGHQPPPAPKGAAAAVSSSEGASDEQPF